jgi:hypothetical protein
MRIENILLFIDGNCCAKTNASPPVRLTLRYHRTFNATLSPSIQTVFSFQPGEAVRFLRSRVNPCK